MVTMLKYLKEKEINDICEVNNCLTCPLNLHIICLGEEEKGPKSKMYVCMLIYEQFKEVLNQRLCKTIETEEQNGN